MSGLPTFDEAGVGNPYISNAPHDGAELVARHLAARWRRKSAIRPVSGPCRSEPRARLCSRGFLTPGRGGDGTEPAAAAAGRGGRLAFGRNAAPAPFGERLYCLATGEPIERERIAAARVPPMETPSALRFAEILTPARALRRPVTVRSRARFARRRFR